MSLNVKIYNNSNPSLSNELQQEINKPNNATKSVNIKGVSYTRFHTQSKSNPLFIFLCFASLGLLPLIYITKTNGKEDLKNIFKGRISHYVPTSVVETTRQLASQHLSPAFQGSSARTSPFMNTPSAQPAQARPAQPQPIPSQPMPIQPQQVPIVPQANHNNSQQRPSVASSTQPARTTNSSKNPTNYSDKELLEILYLKGNDSISKPPKLSLKEIYEISKKLLVHFKDQDQQNAEYGNTETDLKGYFSDKFANANGFGGNVTTLARYLILTGLAKKFFIGRSNNYGFMLSEIGTPPPALSKIYTLADIQSAYEYMKKIPVPKIAADFSVKEKEFFEIVTKGIETAHYRHSMNHYFAPVEINIPSMQSPDVTKKVMDYLVKNSIIISWKTYERSNQVTFALLGTQINNDPNSVSSQWRDINVIRKDEDFIRSNHIHLTDKTKYSKLSKEVQDKVRDCIKTLNNAIKPDRPTPSVTIWMVKDPKVTIEALNFLLSQGLIYEIVINDSTFRKVWIKSTDKKLIAGQNNN